MKTNVEATVVEGPDHIIDNCIAKLQACRGVMDCEITLIVKNPRAQGHHVGTYPNADTAIQMMGEAMYAFMHARGEGKIDAAVAIAKAKDGRGGVER